MIFDTQDNRIRTMHHFDYKGRELYCEDVPVAHMAEAVGTPFYLYSHATLTQHFRAFDRAFDGIGHLICFSMKSNSNLALLRLFSQRGRRGGHRLGRRALPGGQGRGRSAEDRILRGRETGRGDRVRPQDGHPHVQRRIGPGDHPDQRGGRAG